jgi:hypothetical protein
MGITWLLQDCSSQKSPSQKLPLVQCTWSFLHHLYDHQQVKAHLHTNKMINMFPSRSILKYMKLLSSNWLWVRPRLLKILSIFFSVPGSWCLFRPVYWLPSWAYRIDAPFWPPTNAPWKMNGKWLKNNFYWVLVPLLTRVITSIPFFFLLTIYL